MPARTNTFVVIRPGGRSEWGIIMGSAWQDLSKTENRDPHPRPGETILITIGIPFPAGTRIPRYEGPATPLSAELKKKIQAGDPQPVSEGRKPSF